jgi:hypothetical protein
MPSVGLAQNDEELASARILPRVGHRESTHLVLVRVVSGLALDGVSRAPASDARVIQGQFLRKRIPSLHDELRDHPVKHHPIIKLIANELLEVGDREGRIFRKQFGSKGPLVGLESYAVHFRFL